MSGFVQNLGPAPDSFDFMDAEFTAANPRSVAVEASLQDEKHRFSKWVALAVGSRGSRLSVLEIACKRLFMLDDVLTDSRQISSVLKSLTSSEAKLCIVDECS